MSIFWLLKQFVEILFYGFFGIVVAISCAVAGIKIYERALNIFDPESPNRLTSRPLWHNRNPGAVNAIQIMLFVGGLVLCIALSR
jgi:hypothetical protein